ncbi:MAG: cell division/cell wall cluster transcriptional repressor MraZ [Candidatus Spechtbacteria bacterium RIFCSPHIGHO2_02_FULL_43_15b]|uniref:Transcriptional regulator MraZ n=1 Tax=Candidatus Spechtbacteria bacterium RIFCSPHIGHO2_01_FULL_43_30 TaxID=1802158 RepID=A0A1G2H8E4_9BACT|nr:MAG: cell division/cell wall cluster transcriptional repressor MraZ [Candidatus Spechtbacteria bacterium RIFCSPHIGHO2_01_FULL_43_30]OGZ60388.1 MAG: cell division/cell wall cluster transcriptional repressor MraZ [Candidatus Spechtbacteria bacterium RIFCSPHIGHO2_02_FULL_43_15b]
MLIGEYSHTIDEKRRLAIPSKFRKELGNKAIITRGLDNCLFVFPEKEWNDLSEKLKTLPLGQRDARGFIRLILAGAMDVSFDSLGRILVPDYLKEYSKLKKQVIVTGVLNRLEIWDESIWNEYKSRTEKEAGNIAERLGELGV